MAVLQGILFVYASILGCSYWHFHFTYQEILLYQILFLGVLDLLRSSSRKIRYFHFKYTERVDASFCNMEPFGDDVPNATAPFMVGALFLMSLWPFWKFYRGMHSDTHTIDRRCVHSSYQRLRCLHLCGAILLSAKWKPRVELCDCLYRNIDIITLV